MRRPGEEGHPPLKQLADSHQTLTTGDEREVSSIFRLKGGKAYTTGIQWSKGNKVKSGPYNPHPTSAHSPREKA